MVGGGEERRGGRRGEDLWKEVVLGGVERDGVEGMGWVLRNEGGFV